MAGQRVSAKPDVCVMTYSDYVLLVQEDKVSETKTCMYVRIDLT